MSIDNKLKFPPYKIEKALIELQYITNLNTFMIEKIINKKKITQKEIKKIQQKSINKVNYYYQKNIISLKDE